MGTDTRTLLLLTYHFPPSAAVAVHRMLGLVRYLPRFGWNVAVVAPPSMPGEPLDDALLELVPDTTHVARVPFPPGLLGKVGRRVSGNLSWAPAALSACQRIIKEMQPAVVLTSSPPPTVHYLGLYLKKRLGLPWVASLRDPWITNRVLPVQGSPAWNRFMERRMVHNADAIVANTPLNLIGLQNAYPRHADRMTAIPNGFEPSWFPPAPRRFGRRKTLTLLHAGELYSGRDPRPLLDALVCLERETPHAPPFDVRFLGRATEGLCDPEEEIIRRGLIGQVEEQAPYSESLRRMVGADILLLMHTARSRVGVPAKLYEYLGAGRPILALAEPDGDAAWVLRESGVLHRVVRPDDVPAMARALRELRGEIQRGNDLSVQPRNLNPFTRENMARRMAQCLDWVCAPKKERRLLALPQMDWIEPMDAVTSSSEMQSERRHA